LGCRDGGTDGERNKEPDGATPFGFYFITRERGKKDLDSRETKRSGTYYLGGVLLNADDIKNRTDGDYSILLSNMACNNWPTVIENKNSWKIVQPFRKGDTLLDWKPKQLTREENLEGKS